MGVGVAFVVGEVVVGAARMEDEKERARSVRREEREGRCIFVVGWVGSS